MSTLKKDRYENPLCTRYASERMQQIFSPDYKFTTWHRLWLSLAENERALGLPVTAEQVAELRQNLDVIDYEAAARYEKELRHDVMAHIRAWGEHCPRASARRAALWTTTATSSPTGTPWSRCAGCS